MGVSLKLQPHLKVRRNVLLIWIGLILLWFATFWGGVKVFGHIKRPKSQYLLSYHQVRPVKQVSQPVAPPPAPPPAPTPAPVKTAQAAKPKPAPAPAATSEIAAEANCPGQTSLGSVSSVLSCMAAFARTYNKLGSIAQSSQLTAAAEAKSGDMASCGYSHDACGRASDYWIGAKGYSGNCTGENIAQGQATPRDVFISWMSSAGHRANILRADYRHIGAATIAASSGRMWVMELGGC